MDWLTFFGLFFGVILLAYGIANKTLLLRPSQRGLFIGTGLGLILAAGWFMIPWLSPPFALENLAKYFFALLAILIYGAFVAFIYFRRRAGALLISILGPLSKKVSGYITAAMFLLLLLLTASRLVGSPETMSQLFFYSGVILYFASPFFGRTELREQGIIDSYAFYPWSHVVSYVWVGENGTQVLINLDLRWKKSLVIAFPEEQKGSIDSILQHHGHRSS